MGSPPEVVFVGSPCEPLWNVLRRCLAVERRVVRVDSVEEAKSLLEAGAAPALVAIALSWPAEVTQQEIERLRRAAPLCTVLLCPGPWCRGTLCRQLAAWGATLLRDGDFAARARRELADWLAGEPSSLLNLPPTATEGDYLAAACRQRPVGPYATEPVKTGRPCDPLEGIALAAKRHVRGGGGRLTGIVCAEVPFGEMLAEAVRVHGDEPLLVERADRFTRLPQRVIWEISPWSREAAKPLAQFRRQYKSVPVVAISAFVRTEDCNALGSVAPTAVLEKPLLLADLFWQLEHLEIG